MPTVKCSFCGKEMDCPEEMIEAEVHVCPDCIRKDKSEIGMFAAIMQESLDKIGLIITKIQHLDEREIRKILDRIDSEKLMEFKDDFTTEEGLLRMINKAVFGGNWKKYVEWIEKYGTEEQKSKDIALIRKIEVLKG